MFELFFFLAIFASIAFGWVAHEVVTHRRYGRLLRTVEGWEDDAQAIGAYHAAIVMRTGRPYQARSEVGGGQ